jgi:hypothetical protein
VYVRWIQMGYGHRRYRRKNHGWQRFRHAGRGRKLFGCTRNASGEAQEYRGENKNHCRLHLLLINGKTKAGFDDLFPCLRGLQQVNNLL